MSDAGGLIAEDLEHVANAIRKGGMAVEVDILQITGTPLRAQVRGVYVPFGLSDVRAIEAIFGEPICLVSAVVPFAMPLSMAIGRMPEHEWKSAVADNKTILGRDEWNRQHLLNRTLEICLAAWAN